MISALLLLGAVAQQSFPPSNGFANPGFESGTSPWTWNTYNGSGTLVSSSAYGVPAHGGTYEAVATCTYGCAINLVQTFSGSAYRSGAGTVSVWINPSKAFSSSTTDRVLFLTVQAFDASNTMLARDDVLIAGAYNVGSSWDKTQSTTLPANQWTQITLGIRGVLDGRLGSQLSLVDHVTMMFRLGTGATDVMVFFDDALWPMIPDLYVSSLSGAPDTIGVGDSFTANDTVLAAGASAGSFSISYFLATQSSSLTSGTLLGTRSIADGLPANGSNTAWTILSVPPMPPGVYYFGAVVDVAGQVQEISKANNSLVEGMVLVGAFSCQNPAQPLDDGNPCTIDSCDPLTGTTHVPASVGTACTTSTICNGSCDGAGSCTGGVPLTEIPCYAGQCDPVAGVSYHQMPAGTACDDGNACTYGDACSADAVCVGTPVTCVSDACNQRTCNGSPSCTVVPLTGTACNDGNPCTYGDNCRVGVCVGTAIVCNSDACATRTCNGTATCGVTSSPQGTSCDDGDSCTYSDQCDGAGTCRGTPVSCQATGSPCLRPVCNGTAQCSFEPAPAGTPCSDSGNVCGQICDGASPTCQPLE